VSRADRIRQYARDYDAASLASMLVELEDASERDRARPVAFRNGPSAASIAHAIRAAILFADWTDYPEAPSVEDCVAFGLIQLGIGKVPS